MRGDFSSQIAERVRTLAGSLTLEADIDTRLDYSDRVRFNRMLTRLEPETAQRPEWQTLAAEIRAMADKRGKGDEYARKIAEAYSFEALLALYREVVR